MYIFTHIEHPQYVMQEEVILDECADKLCTRQSVSRSLSRVPEPYKYSVCVSCPTVKRGH